MSRQPAAEIEFCAKYEHPNPTDRALSVSGQSVYRGYNSAADCSLFVVRSNAGRLKGDKMNMELLGAGMAAGCSGALSINCIYAANRSLIMARLLEPAKLKRSGNRILVESLFFAALFIVSLFLTADLYEAIYRMVLFTLLYGIAVADALYRIIPNEYVVLIALTAAAMLLTGYSPVSVTEALLGGAAGGLLFIYPFLKDRSCGGGDVKLCAAAGLAIGLTALMAALISMGLILLFYTIYKLLKDKEFILNKFLPMGPVLTACISMQIILLDLFPGYGRFLS